MQFSTSQAHVTRRHFVLATAVAAASAFGTAPSSAQDVYPSKPIRLIVPFGAGGVTDSVARIMAQALQRELGQTVIVENKEGASGMVGSGMVAKAQGDGYTLLFATNVHVINPALRKKLPFDPVADFTPIARVASSPLMLVVNAASPIKTLAEYIANAKARPGEVSYATSGIGTSPHLAAEQFSLVTGTRYIHVPFNVSSASTRAVVAGDVVSSWSGVHATLPYVKDGKVRALAVASEQRSNFAPSLPTFAELGVPGVKVDTWYGVVGPAHMPAAIVDRLSTTILAILAQPETKDKLAAIGAEPAALPATDFRALVGSELGFYAKLARSGGIAVE